MRLYPVFPAWSATCIELSATELPSAMQQRHPAPILDYRAGVSWRGRPTVRLVNHVAGVALTILIAYSLPIIAYAAWAWLRLRPDTFPKDDIPALDPLGFAWQYWSATPSNALGGDSYWAAIEQGERWRSMAVSATVVLVAAVVLIFVRRRPFRAGP